MMDNSFDANAVVTGAASYSDLHSEKRAVVDEVIAAANTMLEQMRSAAFSNRSPHLAVLPIFDQLRALEATVRARPETAIVLEDTARDAIRSLLGSFGRDTTCIDRVDNVLDVCDEAVPSTVSQRPGVEFSVACESYVSELTGRRTMSEKDIARYSRMLAFFRQIAGDRTIASYAQADARRYLTVLRQLPARFSMEEVRIGEDGSLLGPKAADAATRLSIGTIASYVAPVKAVFARECADRKIVNPFDGLKLGKPKKNRPSRSRPLPIDILNRAIAEGERDGSLAALLLPIVGFLTARRIGLLTFLNREWLERVGEHVIVRPTESVVLPGGTARTPIKTDESMVPFALHCELVRLGVVDLIAERGFLFAEAMSASDPAAALSKRMNILLKRAGAKGRAHGQTFHSIRARGIVHYRAHVPQAVRLQAGHAAADEHEGYDWAELEPELVPAVATVPVPNELDLSPLYKADFGRAVALEKRLAKARAARGS